MEIQQRRTYTVITFTAYGQHCNVLSAFKHVSFEIFWREKKHRVQRSQPRLFRMRLSLRGKKYEICILYLLVLLCGYNMRTRIVYEWIVKHAN